MFCLKAVKRLVNPIATGGGVFLRIKEQNDEGALRFALLGVLGKLAKDYNQGTGAGKINFLIRNIFLFLRQTK